MIRFVSLSVLLLAAPAAALAQSEEAQPAPGHGKATFIATYDSDGDGAVTRAEFDSVRQEGFDARDSDGDGAVSPDEYLAEFEARLTTDDEEERQREIRQTISRFDVLDTDKNGALSPKEFAASGEYMFATLDDTKDDIVDAADTTEAY